MIYELLMSKNRLSVDYIDSKKEEIFNIIPELKNEDKFEQKNDWHIYDLWKHTEVALSHSNYDFEERLALLLHDIGKPFSYQNDGETRHFKGHAEKSAEISKDILDRLGYNEVFKNRILFLIKNHSKSINVDNIQDNNINLIQKLLNIQYCDAMAYNPEKTPLAIKRLDAIKEQIDIILKKSIKEKSEER